MLILPHYMANPNILHNHYIIIFLHILYDIYLANIHIIIKNYIKDKIITTNLCHEPQPIKYRLEIHRIVKYLDVFLLSGYKKIFHWSNVWQKNY